VSPIAIRAATAADWSAIVELNDGEVPNVGPLTAGQGEWFLAHSEVSVVDGADGLAAVLVLMLDGCGYASPNYGWFTERYGSFAYVDRIAVHRSQAGRGVGRALYDHAVAFARAHHRSVLMAEVNLVPPNERSLAFHAAYGFERIGEHIDLRSGFTEAMLALDVI
jgi:uncharacterized protein